MPVLSRQLKQRRGCNFARSGSGACAQEDDVSKDVKEGWMASQEQPDIIEVSMAGDSGGPGRQQQKVGR